MCCLLFSLVLEGNVFVIACHKHSCLGKLMNLLEFSGLSLLYPGTQDFNKQNSLWLVNNTVFYRY